MKFVKWNILFVTVLVCLLPILFGIFFWEQLPHRVAIHFNWYGEPDGFSSRGFVVFGLPCLMAALQALGCVLNDFTARNKNIPPKVERITKWMIPMITVVLFAVTLGYAMGWNPDIRRIVSILLGAIFLVTGNYLPKLDFIKNYPIDSQKARKINRFLGIETVILGGMFLVSVFLPPVASVICLILLIPYLILGIIYGIYVGKQN